MKNNKKPMIIILVIILMVAGGLLLANYMLKQVDIQLEKKETLQSFHYEDYKNIYLVQN